MAGNDLGAYQYQGGGSGPGDDLGAYQYSTDASSVAVGILGGIPAINLTTTAAEDFESNTLSDDYVGDDPAVFSIISDSNRGSNVLEYAPGSASDRLQFADENSHPAPTMERGQTYRVAVWDDKTYSGGGYLKVPVLVPSAATKTYDNFDGYMFELSSSGPEIRLHVVSGGTRTTTKTSDIGSFTTGAYHEAELRLDTPSTAADTIEAELFDETGTSMGTVSVTDTSYSSGVFGFGGYRATLRFDDLRAV